MHNVGTHLALRGFHEFLDLLHVRVDETGASCALERVVARITQANVALHGLVVGAGQLGRRPRATGQIERFKYFHDLLILLGQDASSDVDSDVSVHLWKRRGTVRNGSSAVRPWGDLVSASGDFSVRLWGE